MKIVMYVLIVVVAIIAIPFVVALFVKNEYSIQRELVINKPVKEVFDYVKIIKNQDNYSKWVMTDPAMKKEFRGTDGQVGFVYGWNGNNKAGEGEQEIKKIVDDSRVEMEIRFKRPMVAVANTAMITEEVGSNQTKVKWGMSGRTNYPMNFMNLFNDKLLGTDLEISLTNLKTILEKN